MPSDDGTLLAVERQRIILAILEREGVVRNAELKELLNVSLVTIRSDLRELESQGECEIIWGGAVSKRPSPERELVLNQRSQLNPDIKKRIGERAAQLVEIGQTIMVDAGTTTVEMVRHLPRDLDYLRIVTPALNIAAAAAYFPNIELVMTGGVLRNLTHSLVGPQAIRTLELVNADTAFLATGGFSLDRGITTSNYLEVEVKRTMVHQSNRVVVMADSTKFGKVLSLSVTPMHEIDILITDFGVSDSDAQAIERRGVQVIRI
jgi:DeoR family transcriptional regulator, fructose operon transcriptional repressor